MFFNPCLGLPSDDTTREEGREAARDGGRKEERKYDTIVLVGHGEFMHYVMKKVRGCSSLPPSLPPSIPRPS